MPGKPAADLRVNVYIDGYNFYVPLSTMEERYYELCWCDFPALAQLLIVRLGARRPRDFGRCQLGAVKYFTATIPDDMPKDSGGIERKYQWLDALHSHSAGKVEVIHGTFRPRKHRFYIERGELDNLVRGGIPVDWSRLAPETVTFHPNLKIHEEKQTDVMLATSLVTDAALGRAGHAVVATSQEAPHHRTNRRPTPSPCHAAIVVSADTDFVPAAEMAAGVFGCPVAIAFTFPYSAYRLDEGPAAHGPQLPTLEVTEEELRRCMMPREIALPDGRRIEFEKVRKSHFTRVRKTGG